MRWRRVVTSERRDSVRANSLCRRIPSERGLPQFRFGVFGKPDTDRYNQRRLRSASAMGNSNSRWLAPPGSNVVVEGSANLQTWLLLATSSLSQRLVHLHG